MTVALARNQAGRPRSRSFEVARRIARRRGPAVAAAFLRAIARLDAGISDVALASALASGNLNAIEAAVGASRLSVIFAGGGSLAELLERTGADAGTAAGTLLADVTGVEFTFNRLDPNVIMFARERSARLVVSVSDDVREAIRIVTATGAAEGLTIRQQAVAIRQVVGLPPPWVRAPLNLADELRNGTFTSSRRLSAIEKAQIRKRLREGTMDEAFIDRMQQRYAESLTNRRALNIARTETAEAAMHGTRTGWRQAADEGVIPKTARRVFIVTPDDKLRPTHAAVPGMNRGGVALDEPFRTPLGPRMGPPIEPNCRCGEGLRFPGTGGVL